MKVLGIDESGKCPVLGSIWIAGVIVYDSQYKLIEKIKDCKVVSRPQIKILYDKFSPIFKCNIQELTAREIDDNNPSTNLNDKIMLKYIEIIKWGYRKVDKIVIDNWEADRENFWLRFQKIDPKYYKKIDKRKFIIEHKADENYKEVALASIFSKWNRDRQEDFLKAKYDVGSTNPNDNKTLRFIYQNYDDLPDFVRKKWITVRRLEDPQNMNNLKDTLTKAGLI